MNTEKLPYKDYLTIYNKVPRLCIDLIFRRNDTVLLVKRDVTPGIGLWHFPGGTILRGENLLHAARRTGFDEARIDITEISFLRIMEFAEEKNQFFHVVSLVHEVKFDDFQASDSSDLKYFSLKSLPENIIQEQKSFLESKFKK